MKNETWLTIYSPSGHLWAPYLTWAESCSGRLKTLMINCMVQDEAIDTNMKQKGKSYSHCMLNARIITTVSKTCCVCSTHTKKIQCHVLNAFFILIGMLNWCRSDQGWVRVSTEAQNLLITALSPEAATEFTSITLLSRWEERVEKQSDNKCIQGNSHHMCRGILLLPRKLTSPSKQKLYWYCINLYATKYPLNLAVAEKNVPWL